MLIKDGQRESVVSKKFSILGKVFSKNLFKQVDCKPVTINFWFAVLNLAISLPYDAVLMPPRPGRHSKLLLLAFNWMLACIRFLQSMAVMMACESIPEWVTVKFFPTCEKSFPFINILNIYQTNEYISTTDNQSIARFAGHSRCNQCDQQRTISSSHYQAVTEGVINICEGLVAVAVVVGGRSDDDRPSVQLKWLGQSPPSTCRKLGDFQPERNKRDS